MVDALKTLGVQLEERWGQTEIVVHGCNGRFTVEGAELFLGNAGTAMRWEPQQTKYTITPGSPYSQDLENKSRHIINTR